MLEALTREDGRGLERHVRTLEAVDVAEEGEMIASVGGARRCRRLVWEPVRYDGDAIGGETVRDITLLEEFAGRDEQVDLVERTADVQLAQLEIREGAVGKTLPARIGLSAFAKLPCGRDHLPVIRAKRIVVVQRHDDPGSGRASPDQADQFAAQTHEMMEMDDVGLLLDEEVGDGVADPVQVDLRLKEWVETAGPDQQLVSGGADGLEWRAGTGWPLVGRGRSDEQAIDIARSQGAEQIARKDLGAAGLKIRVGVEHEQYAHHAAPFSNTPMSWNVSLWRPLQLPYRAGFRRRRPCRKNNSSRTSSSKATAARGASL